MPLDFEQITELRSLNTLKKCSPTAASYTVIVWATLDHESVSVLVGKFSETRKSYTCVLRAADRRRIGEVVYSVSRVFFCFWRFFTHRC